MLRVIQVGPRLEIELDGKRLEHVRNITVFGERNELVKAEIELYVEDVAMLDGEVIWTGLEEVPEEALEAELQKRRME